LYLLKRKNKNAFEKQKNKRERTFTNSLSFLHYTLFFLHKYIFLDKKNNKIPFFCNNLLFLYAFILGCFVLIQFLRQKNVLKHKKQKSR
jgi:hypothetical protein